MRALIAVIEGDGIGPEIVPHAVTVLRATAMRFGHDFSFVPADMGAGTWKRTGSALPPETLDICRRSDAILLGATGATGAADAEHRGSEPPPGWGRRQLCRELGYHASIRPAMVSGATRNAGPIKSERVDGTDIVIVRDYTLVNKTGVAESQRDATGRMARDTLEFREAEVAPTLEFSLRLAQSRRRKLCLMAQTSIFATSKLWMALLEEMAGRFVDVEVEVQAPDNCAMQLMRNPAAFDVIVSDSTPMGGMLNNLAALLLGSVGMAPGATVALQTGSTFAGMIARSGLYEPIHGSAPLRAGQGIVNPIGTILAAALLLRYGLGLEQEARAVELAVERTLAEGHRTYDIMEPGMTQVGTQAMGERIAAHLGTTGGQPGGRA